MAPTSKFEAPKVSRSVGTMAAIEMPSATDATGRLKMIMRSAGVCRQRRAPTSERASHARLPASFASGDGGACSGTRLKASRSAPEKTNETAFSSSTKFAEVSPTSAPPSADSRDHS